MRRRAPSSRECLASQQSYYDRRDHELRVTYWRSLVEGMGGWSIVASRWPELLSTAAALHTCGLISLIQQHLMRPGERLSFVSPHAINEYTASLEEKGLVVVLSSLGGDSDVKIGLTVSCVLQTAPPLTSSSNKGLLT